LPKGLPKIDGRKESLGATAPYRLSTSGVLISPFLGGDRPRIGPETSPALARQTLRIEQILGRSVPAKHPGIPFCHHLSIDHAIVDPERAQETAILIARCALHSYAAAQHFAFQHLLRCLSVGLTKLRGINANESDFLERARCIDAGDCVAVVDCLY